MEWRHTEHWGFIKSLEKLMLSFFLPRLWQAPGELEMSSIAISPLYPFPRTPSKITCRKRCLVMDYFTIKKTHHITWEKVQHWNQILSLTQATHPVGSWRIESGLPLVPRLALVEVSTPNWLSTRRGSSIGLIQIKSAYILSIHLVVKCQTDRGSRVLRSVLGTD